MFWRTQGKKRLRSWELFGIIDVPGTTQERNGSAHRPSKLSYEENEREASVGGDKEDEREQHGALIVQTVASYDRSSDKRAGLVYQRRSPGVRFQGGLEGEVR